MADRNERALKFGLPLAKFGRDPIRTRDRSASKYSYPLKGIIEHSLPAARASLRCTLAMGLGQRIATIYDRKSRFFFSVGGCVSLDHYRPEEYGCQVVACAGGFEMRQNFRIAKVVQHLDQINTNFLKQMIELEELRQAVRLAEAGKPFRQSEKLRHPRLAPKVIEPLASPQLRA